MRIVFVTSHPIQYQVPIFRLLDQAPGVELTVLYAMLPDASAQGAGFGVAFEWDIPLLEGYTYKVLNNVAKQPGVTHFSGCDTPEIDRELAALKPDAVVINGWVVKTCLQALWACKRRGIPCLVRGEANDLRPRAGWKRWLQGLLVRQYRACLFIGKASRAFYQARGVSTEKLFPAPYCIENERFAAAAAALHPERSALRQQWSIEDDAVCFLFCGKFEEKKRPLELIGAFAQARRQNAKLHLLMVGDGDLRARCEQLVEEMQLPVTFAGFLNQSAIVAAYVAADCLVLPSDAGETWGLVVNEAMACGLPALVSDRVGCAEDLVVPGETGEIFEFGDWGMLADQLSSPGLDAGRLATMGRAARKRIADYSPAMAAGGILEAARSVKVP